MDIFFYSVIGTLVGTLIAMVLVSEGGAYLGRLNQRIVSKVLSQLPEELPEELRQRWIEEIEGDIKSLSKQPIYGLWFALSLRRLGARRLAAELVLQVALSAPVPRTPDTHSPTPSDIDRANSGGWLVNEYARELKERLALGYEGLEERDERRPSK